MVFLEYCPSMLLKLANVKKVLHENLKLKKSLKLILKKYNITKEPDALFQIIVIRKIKK